jgi:hypothetical protein
MTLGTRLHELSRLRKGVIASVALATLVTIWSLYRISILPPGLQARTMDIGGATTHVLVDTPRSELADIRASVTDFEALTTRADLLGNLMASWPVRQYIGRVVGVDPARISTIAPITISVPRALVEPGSEKRVTSILDSRDQYRLQIGSNPTVPVLDIYSQAPTKDAAVKLANAAVQGLQQYMTDLSNQQHIAPDQQIRLIQFGGAIGGVINQGIAIQIGAFVFFAVFAMSCSALIFLQRVKLGWSVASIRPEAQS